MAVGLLFNRGFKILENTVVRNQGDRMSVPNDTCFSQEIDMFWTSSSDGNAHPLHASIEVERFFSQEVCNLNANKIFLRPMANHREQFAVQLNL